MVLPSIDPAPWGLGVRKEDTKFAAWISEVMTIIGRITAAEARTDLLIPIYSYVLLWFFLYCYPIALWTKRLELRYAER